jgi:hypothetical protein
MPEIRPRWISLHDLVNYQGFLMPKICVCSKYNCMVNFTFRKMFPTICNTHLYSIIMTYFKLLFFMYEQYIVNLSAIKVSLIFHKHCYDHYCASKYCALHILSMIYFFNTAKLHSIDCAIARTVRYFAKNPGHLY